MITKEEPKQETLEEAAENAFNRFQNENPIVPSNHIRPYKLGFINGIKWQVENSNINALHFEINALKRLIKVLEHQQERMYSEEDMIAFGKFCHNDAHSSTYFSTFNLLLEQFKKKKK